MKCILIFLVLILGLSGCDSGNTFDKEFHYCIDNGGSFKTDDTDFSCTLPANRDDR